MTESNTPNPDEAGEAVEATPVAAPTPTPTEAHTPTEADATETTPIAPESEQPVAQPAAAPAAPVTPVDAPAVPVASPAAPTVPPAVAAAAAAPSAAQAAATPVTAPPVHHAPTDAFGQPVAPHATVYAPNAAPQAYAGQPGYPQAGYTQPTQPYGTQPYGAVPATDTSAKKKSRGALPIVAALIAGAVIGGISGAGVSSLVSNNGGTSNTSTATAPQNVVVNDTSSVNEITAVAAKASPSVVTINVAGGNSGGTGSGVVLSSDGYILTNTHVVTLDGATSDVTVQVETNDGKLYAGKVVGTDPTLDLAVIKMSDVSGLTPLDFADSDKLNVGETAIAIGAPLGLAGTVTNGVVSAINRSIQIASSAAPTEGDTTEPDPNGQSPFDFWNFDGQDGSQDGSGKQQQATSTISLPVVQTDAAINPGNSGGALLDSKGDVIGINVAIASAGSTSSSDSQSGSIGVGFAIPSNVAKRVADAIIKDGKVSHGLLGASVSDVTTTDAGVVGAEIKEVTSGGAAEDAGLKAGDIVTEFNGRTITSSSDLTAQVRSLAAGSKASLSYVRGGKSESADVTLGELTS